MAIELPIELDNGHTYRYFKMEWVRLEGDGFTTATASYRAYKNRNWFVGGNSTDADLKVVLSVDLAGATDVELAVDTAFLDSDEITVRGKKGNPRDGRRVD